MASRNVRLMALGAHMSLGKRDKKTVLKNLREAARKATLLADEVEQGVASYSDDTIQQLDDIYVHLMESFNVIEDKLNRAEAE